MFWKVFWLGLFSAAAIYIFNAILQMDVNKRVYNHRPGPCRALKGIAYGSEDVAFIEDEGLAFITSGLFYMTPRPPQVEGNIFLYDFNHPDKDPLKLPIVGMKERKSFHPHGLTHWQEGKKVRLYVINHREPDFVHSVEVFDYDPKKIQLNHVNTIRDEKFVRPNDIITVSFDKFILSNDGTAQTPFMNILEMLTFYKGGSLVLYDGKQTHFLKTSLMTPNGLAIDREGKHLIVAMPQNRDLAVYKLGKDFKSLATVSKLNLQTTPDNLWIDKDNAIWTGAHPVLHHTAQHLSNMDDLEIYAPSQVLRIKYTPDWKKLEEVNEVFADDGQLISASSVAVLHKEKLLIGGVCRQAVVCDVVYKGFD